VKKHPRKIPEPPKPPVVPGITQHRLNVLKEVQSELKSRKIEALRLYQPMPHQEEMHACMASERIVLGGNRSGKSLSTFVEDARALTGQDPHNKYPTEGGNLVVVGRNWPHIGLVCYPMLFKAGAFKIIKDAETKEWRAFNPVTDSDRKKEAKPAPPLVPNRLVEDVSWVLKNAGYCQRVVLSNGWTVHFFSSEGEPPQGFQADLVHLDEDVSNPSWVGEMQARLADRKGRMLWSAMPHSKNDALLGLCERADKEAEEGRDQPRIKKFTFPDGRYTPAIGVEGRLILAGVRTVYGLAPAP
jgi:hypothetical protein